MTFAFTHEPKVVYEAFTEPTILTQWFCEHADIDLDAGRYDFWGKYTPGAPSRRGGHRKVVAWEGDRLLRYAWRFRGRPTTVELALAPSDDGGTDLRLVHDNLPTWQWKHGGAPGNFWGNVLTSLRGLLETNDAGLRYDFSTTRRGGCEISVDIKAPPESVWTEVRAEVDRWKAEAERDGYPVELLNLVEGRQVGIPQRGGDNENYTIVTFTLEGSGGGTRLTLVQSGFADPDDLTEGHTLGWVHVLLHIKYLVELGASPRSWGRTIASTSPGIDRRAYLRDNVVGRADAHVDTFAASLGGYGVLLPMVFEGLVDRIDPRDDCAVAFSIADAGEWTVVVRGGQKSVDAGAAAADATVHMQARDYLRLITLDVPAPELIGDGRMVIDGEPTAVDRLFALVV
jgi:uncharacterized protein YndB with AHSA1/START domain